MALVEEVKVVVESDSSMASFLVVVVLSAEIWDGKLRDTIANTRASVAEAIRDPIVFPLNLTAKWGFVMLFVNQVPLFL
ncbi:hypothetical protein E2542_SST22896 [Spatholobus suberectus]|nr:hypothetical protein E2542_SST22896 [Spatholobus suberectus]